MRCFARPALAVCLASPSPFELHRIKFQACEADSGQILADPFKAS